MSKAGNTRLHENGNAGRPREEATTSRANIAAILIACIVLTIGRTAWCADLVGRVLSRGGEAVSGITVRVVNAKDVEAGKAVSDANGSYAISNLAPGTYKFNIVPGQWVMSYIGDKGLTVNWGLAPHSPPVAVATLGIAADNLGTRSAAPSKISHAETGGSGRIRGTTN